MMYAYPLKYNNIAGFCMKGVMKISKMKDQLVQNLINRAKKLHYDSNRHRLKVLINELGINSYNLLLRKYINGT